MASSGKRKAGQYRDNVNSNNVTDPMSKDRDENGFPFADQAASGILRKKLIEFLAEERSRGGATLVEKLRKSRWVVAAIVLEVALKYQVTDHVALILSANEYEVGSFKSKGERLEATNQFVQGIYQELLTTEADMCEINTKEASDLGAEQLTSLLLVLTEAVCQINKRNEGKSAFVVSKGYQGDKRGRNQEFLDSFKEAMTELIRANSLKHYWNKLAKDNKLAKEEERELSTLMRILFRTVCPDFGPKDYVPRDAEGCDELEEVFKMAAKEYYDSCYEKVLQAMSEAKEEQKRRVDEQDGDFFTQFDGDFSAGQLFSHQAVASSKEIKEVDDHFNNEMNDFMVFIYVSYTNFVKRGSEYFDSQRAMFEADGGLDSNLAMTNAALVTITALGEAGIFLGSEETKDQVLSEYEEIQKNNFKGGLPDIVVQSLTDEDAVRDPEFSETNFVMAMGIDTLNRVKPQVSSERFINIRDKVSSMQGDKDFGETVFEDICIVVDSKDPKLEEKFSVDEQKGKEEEKGSEEDEEEEEKESEQKKEREKKGFLTNFVTKEWTDSSFLNTEALETMISFGFQDPTGRTGFYMMQIADLMYTVTKMMEDDPTTSVEQLKQFVEDRAPLMRKNIDPKIDVEERIGLLKFFTGDSSTLNHLMHYVVKGTDVKLNHYYETVLDSLKDIIWRVFRITADLTDDHYSLIDKQFEDIRHVLMNLQQSGQNIGFAETKALIRMAYYKFFVLIDHGNIGGSVGMELVSDLNSLPISADISLEFHHSIIESGTTNSMIMSRLCTASADFIEGEVSSLKAQKTKRGGLSKDDKARRKFFGKRSSDDFNHSKSSAIHSFCSRKDLKVVNYKNTKANCLFHTFGLISEDPKEPKKMRKEVVRKVRESKDYDDYFLQDGVKSDDPMMKTKEDWIKTMPDENIFGDQIAMTVMMEGIDLEVTVFHTSGYQVTFNKGKTKSKMHILCQDSFHFVPVVSSRGSEEPEKVVTTLLRELETGQTKSIRSSLRKANTGKNSQQEEGKKKSENEKELEAMIKLLELEVEVCQAKFKGRGYEVQIRLGDDAYYPKLKGGLVYQFVHVSGGKTFEMSLRELAEHMAWYDYGCTTGKGAILPSYMELMENPDINEMVGSAIQEWNSDKEKEKRTKKKDDKSQESGEKEKKEEHKTYKAPGSYAATKKLVFCCDVLLIEQSTFVRVLMAIISAITMFFAKQTLDFAEFSFASINWDARRAGTGIPEPFWSNLGRALVRNMKKKFKQDLYLYPCLPRKQTLVNLTSASNLISTGVSYMINGPGDSAFVKLCNLCVMSCRADIPEDTVHAMHQFLLSGLDQTKYLSNKTSFRKNLWENVKFRDEDKGLKKEFQKGKPL